MSFVTFCTVTPVFLQSSIQWCSETGQVPQANMSGFTACQPVPLNTEVETDFGYERALEDFPRKTQRSRKLTTQLKSDPLAKILPSIDRNYLDFPFLRDQTVCQYLRKRGTQVMFIMRGLSGSGKSTIVSALKCVYQNNVAVCSADDFFFNSDGEYKFNEKLLASAHSECQNKAKVACQNKVPIIVIDNTNIKKWEMTFYWNQACVNGYVVILVEPKTPWKWDAHELMTRNKHGVDLTVLKRKMHMFDDIIPSYYGWFMNEQKSKELSKLCSCLFFQCLEKIPTLKGELSKGLDICLKRMADETSSKALWEHFSENTPLKPLLHCTSRFCGRGKVPGSQEYHQRPDVQNSCGQLFVLEITALVITKRTVSFRVSLSAEAKALFNRPEENVWGSKEENLKLASRSPHSDTGIRSEISYGKRSKRKEKKELRKTKKELRRVAKHRNNFDNDVEEKPSFDHISKDGDEEVFNEECSFNSTDHDGTSPHKESDIFCEDFAEHCSVQHYKGVEGDGVSLLEQFPCLNYIGFARSAHTTVMTAHGVESRQANFDILHLCDIEKGRKYTSSDFVSVKIGKAWHYEDGCCCVYFDKPIEVHTLFSGFY